MKEIVQTKSWQVIKAILSVDNTYDGLVYDDSPSLRDYSPDVENNVWFILLEDGYTAGIITLEYMNNVMWNCHIVIYEQYRGKGSEEWGKLVAQYMRDKYRAKKLLAITPYEAAKSYAERVGFLLLTTLTKSIKKNGKLMDQYMLEMS